MESGSELSKTVSFLFFETPDFTDNSSIKTNIRIFFSCRFNLLSTNPTKWSNTPNSSANCRQIVWVCLTILCGCRLKLFRRLEFMNVWTYFRPVFPFCTLWEHQNLWSKNHEKKFLFILTVLHRFNGSKFYAP